MDKEKKTIIISGASGMIGVALVGYALEMGCSVVCLVRKNSSSASRLKNRCGVTVIELDLSDYNNYRPTLKADMFFHLAWDKTTVSGRDDVDCQLRNVQYTVDAVALAEKFGCSVFVGAGSQAEYGVKDSPLTSDMAVSPESGYGIAKFCAGRLSALCAKQKGIRHVWARILSVYGVNDNPNSLISYLVTSFQSKTVPKLTKCEQDWDYIFETDCAKALYALALYGKDQKAYPIGGGKPRKLKDYVLAVRDAVDDGQEVNFGEKEYYPHQPMTLIADVSDLKNDTGFVPQVDFEQGIRIILNRGRLCQTERK